MIECSVGKGVMSEEECLTCALNEVNPPCGYDYSLLRRIYTDAERTGIHVTDLTGCLRKSYYDKVRPVPISPSQRLILTLGTVAHAMLEGDDINMVTEMDVEALGVVGRMDVYYRNGRIVDFKTTRWMMPDKLPYGSHALQVNIYAELMRQNGFNVDSMAIQYIDMSGPSKCRKCKSPSVYDNGLIICPVCNTEIRNGHLGAMMIEIPPIPDIEDFIVERRDKLSKSLDDEVSPDAEPSFLCKYCNHVDICDEALT